MGEVRILLLAGSIGVALVGALYGGVHIEHVDQTPEAEANEIAIDGELIMEPITNSIPEASSAVVIATPEPLSLLDEGDTSGEITLEDGLRIGAMTVVWRDGEDFADASSNETPDSTDPTDSVAETTEAETTETETAETVANETRSKTRRPRRRVRREPPPPPGPRLHRNAGMHTVLTARRMIARNELIRGSCYHFLSEVYARAGHSGWRNRRIVHRSGRDGPYADLSQIRPGDWLYIVNNPHSTPVGTHSVMFTGWRDQARGYANVISHPGWGSPRAGRERTYDISRTYRIIRPVSRQN